MMGVTRIPRRKLITITKRIRNDSVSPLTREHTSTSTATRYATIDTAAITKLASSQTNTATAHEQATPVMHDTRNTIITNGWSMCSGTKSRAVARMISPRMMDLDAAAPT